ncbi:MAG TPA: hypothetical protein VH497_07640 [Vicinamibacterales bacterium]
MTASPRERRYLLGELSEAEMTAFEREYMSDPEVFAQLIQSETTLVDDYVRRRLPLPVRQRFEEHYLSHPKRRERVAFANALVTKIDERQPGASPGAEARSWWNAIGWFGSHPALNVALASAAAILLLASGWFLIQSSRLQRELARTEHARSLNEQRARELQDQLSAAQAETRALTTELERLKTGRAEPNPPPNAGPALVSLLLTVPSARTATPGDAPTVAIPAGTRELGIQLAMNEAEYATYQVSLNPVAAPVVFSRSHLAPRRSSAGSRLSVSVPAAGIVPGDYVLTLSGEMPGGGLDEVSQLLFRVTR